MLTSHTYSTLASVIPAWPFHAPSHPLDFTDILSLNYLISRHPLHNKHQFKPPKNNFFVIYSSHHLTIDLFQITDPNTELLRYLYWLPHNNCDDYEMLWPQELITFFYHLIFWNSVRHQHTLKTTQLESRSADNRGSWWTTNWPWTTNAPSWQKKANSVLGSLGPARFAFPGECPAHGHKND